jgi:hypothetical protein
VLTVAIEVDDDVGAERESSVNAAAERGDQTAGATVTHDTIGARRIRDDGCSIRRPVVDDNHSDVADVRDPSRDGCDHCTDVRRLVERRDDDRQAKAATAARR